MSTTAHNFAELDTHSVVDNEVVTNEIVHYQSDSLKRTVLINTKQLTPKGQNQPLKIDDYQFSSDQSMLLIYTNSEQVWRSKSRGDYWLYDIKKQKL